MPKTKVKKPKIPELYWRELTATYLTFMELKFEHKVPLTGSQPRDLKVIVRRLRELAEEGKIAWTSNIACRSLHLFLHFGWELKICPHSEEWFIIRANQRKQEILDHIHQYKQYQKNG